MKRNVRYALAALLILVILGSLAAFSFVSARPLADDVMTSHLITIPEGSTHPDYNGDYVTGDRTINLYTGWTTNLPWNTCAIAVRFGYRDNVVGHWGALRPNAGQAAAVLARTQVVNVWSDSSGIVPVSGANPHVRLDISSPGYVYMAITGYWLCDDYVRPTLTP